MSLEVLEERVNVLLGRREARLVVRHEGAGTPDRLTVRRLASDYFKAPLDHVFVKSIATRAGGSSALCRVEVYDDTSKAERVVPHYLKNRHLPREQRKPKKRGEEAKPAGEERKTAEAKGPKPQEPKPADAKDARAPAKKEAKPAA